MILRFFLLTLLLLLSPLGGVSSADHAKAFPTAEGFGGLSHGGRGGRVMFVDNLNDSGPGSFRDCAQQSGARTCLFRVAGTIVLNSPVTITEGSSYVTIAGQTAPGDGVQLKNYWLRIGSGAHDVTIRFLRIRSGVEYNPPDTNNCSNIVVYADLGSPTIHDVIIDHSSFHWACDDATQVWAAVDNVTYQWNIIGSGLVPADYGGADVGSKGLIHGGGNASHTTMHHNLYIHLHDRLPNASWASVLDFRNNVIYNWGECHGVVDLAIGNNFTFGTINMNWVANKYIPGPTDNCVSWVAGGQYIGYILGTQGRYYTEGNVTPWCLSGCAANATLASQGFRDWTTDSPVTDAWRVGTPFPAATVTMTPMATLEAVMVANPGVGATKPSRDSLDQLMLTDLQNRTGQLGQHGLPWPTLNSGPVPTDTDQDGMPDAWEMAHGLNPNSGSDGAAVNTAGGNHYTNLELYLNELAGETAPTAPLPLQLAFTTQPSTTPTNQTMAPVVVQAQDASGNLVSSYSANVTVALATGSVSVPFAGTSLVSVDSFDPGYEGTKALDGLPDTMWHSQFTGGNPPHPHQIIVNLGASYPVNGFQYLPRIDAVPYGIVGQYEWYVSATGGTCPGAAWGTATATGTLAFDHTLKIVAATEKTGQYVCFRALTDGLGGPDTSMAELTTLYNPGGGTGQLLGSPTQPASGGIATFSNLSINAPGTYTLLATAAGLSTATSATFSIGTGPTHLRFTQQPQTSLVGQIMQAFTVQFEDSANNVISTTQAIAIAFGANPGGSLLAGTVTRPAVAGVATFNDLSVTNVGGVGYTFVASAPPSTPATSAPFTILGQPPVPREWVATRASAYQCAESGGDTNVSAFADTALIPQASLSLVAVDSANASYGGALAIDGDDLTFWHTEFDPTSPPHPHSIIVDLGASYTVTAFQHLRRQDGTSSQVGGGILGYQFYVSPTVMSLPCSASGGTAVASGTMPDVQTASTIQTTPKVGRYVCLVALSEVEGNPWTSMAEMRVFQTTGVGSGAAYVHTLACAIRAGDLRAQGLLQTCALLEVATVGAASTAILELHLGNIVLNTNAGASITQTLTSNSWVCFDTVIPSNPGATVPTYSSYLQTAPSFARVTGRGGITPQPVNVNTAVAEIAAFASRWLSSSGGDDGITLKTMTMGLSK